MSQPYDLSGLAALDVTLNQMLGDQASGATGFAGSEQSWIASPTGWFKAILTSGGSPSPTNADAVRTSFKSVRTIFDLLAGGTGSAAALAVQASTPPSLLLETGRSPTGPQTAYGPVMNAASFVASTSYDLSGIANLQTTANAMLADALSGATVFTGWGEAWKPSPKGQFQAILVPNGAAQAATIGTVLDRMNLLQKKLGQLGTDRR